MNKDYQRAIKVLEDIFRKDMTLVLGTVDGDKPDLRYVDTYFYRDSFYIVAHESTNKVKQIAKNKNVSLCYRLHRFSGEAINIGHPLLPENKEIRDMLTKEFADWYFAHNNEKDPKMCYIRVELHTGFTYQDKVGYNINFKTTTADTFTYKNEIVPCP